MGTTRDKIRGGGKLRKRTYQDDDDDDDDIVVVYVFLLPAEAAAAALCTEAIWRIYGAPAVSHSFWDLRRGDICLCGALWPSLRHEI